MQKISEVNIVTRFAPSPTGYLHIGGARTALFNWMYARKYSGKFLLRIENTDKERSFTEAETAIFRGLEWLGLNWDDSVIYQVDRKDRHLEIAELLMKNDLAYKCYSTKEEIETYKKNALKKGISSKFISPWRAKKRTKTCTKSYVVRLRVPDNAKTVIEDRVQGTISWNNRNLDDLVLLRSDGTATYNLAVVVDDFDSNISHVIRGDDHLANAPKQKLIYQALGWHVPIFAHIPLIHGSDGKKLSKRHGAVGLDYYQKKGISAPALQRYLSQLGWDSGNDDLLSTQQLIANFQIENIIKSPARFDLIKLNDICGKVIRNTSDGILLSQIDEFLEVAEVESNELPEKELLRKSLPFLKTRAKNLEELYNEASFLLPNQPNKIEENCLELVTRDSLCLLRELTNRLNNVIWERDFLNKTIHDLATENLVKFKDIAQMVRIAMVGKLNSPGIIDMMLILGKLEVVSRFNKMCDIGK